MITVSSSVRDGLAMISLSGRFDFNGRKAFREAYTPLLSDPAVRALEIGLRQVEYIDSSALGILLLLRERAKDAGKSITLTGANQTVAKVLEVANFERLFEIRA